MSPMEKTHKISKESFSLPTDLAQDIFTWLPPKSLIKFRCLSKFWHAQIAHPSFIQKHYCDDNEEYYPNSFTVATSGEYIKVLGSCDGFYCCMSVRAFKLNIYLYNPSIRRVINIPYLFSITERSVLGVGYQDSMCDVKLVKINQSDGTTMVYSVNKNSWETINNVSPDAIVRDRWSVFTGGCIYWCGKSTIVGFDLLVEVFRQIPYPTHGSRLPYGSLLSVVKGSLYFMPRPSDDSYCWIYKLKQEENAWEKIYEGLGPIIRYPNVFQVNYVIEFTCECKILVGRSDGTGWLIVMAYDVQTKQERFIKRVKQWNSWVPMRKKGLQLLHLRGEYFHAPSI